MRRSIAAALVLATVFVVVSSGFWAHAQVIVPQVPSPPPGPQVLNVISGDDLGFLVDHWEGDTPAGRWVIRNAAGRWVVPKTLGGVKRLTN
jgi:hypothetical protein